MPFSTNPAPPINVYVERNRYLVQPQFPWLVTAHDALVHTGAWVRLYVLFQPEHYARLGPVVERKRDYVVYQVYERSQRCPMYLKFPRSPPSALVVPSVSRERRN